MSPARLIPIVAALLTLGGGCAGGRPVADAEPTLRRAVPLPPTPALAFTPPVAYGLPDDLGLARAGRGVYADGGYEAVVISETYTRQDDRQRWSPYGREQGTFERRSVSTTVTVRQR